MEGEGGKEALVGEEGMLHTQVRAVGLGMVVMEVDMEDMAGLRKILMKRVVLVVDMMDMEDMVGVP